MILACCMVERLNPDWYPKLSGKSLRNEAASLLVKDRPAVTMMQQFLSTKSTQHSFTSSSALYHTKLFNCLDEFKQGLATALAAFNPASFSVSESPSHSLARIMESLLNCSESDKDGNGRMKSNKR